jgi:hypothetical protein
VNTGLEGGGFRVTTMSTDGQIFEIVRIPGREAGSAPGAPVDPVYRTSEGLPVEKISPRRYRIPALCNLVVTESFSLL